MLTAKAGILAWSHDCKGQTWAIRNSAKTTGATTALAMETAPRTITVATATQAQRVGPAADPVCTPLLPRRWIHRSADALRPSACPRTCGSGEQVIIEDPDAHLSPLT